MICLLFFFSESFGQKNVKDLLKQADEFYRAGSWPEAYDHYNRYLEMEPKKETARYRMAETLLRLDRPQEAVIALRPLFQKRKKIPARWNLTLGEAFHQLSDFRVAEHYYRAFFETRGKETDARRARYLLMQVAVGQRYSGRTADKYVENLGSKINSSGGEFGVVYSPNFDNRIYYNGLTRSGNPATRRADSPEAAKNRQMLQAEIVNGKWQFTGELDETIAGVSNPLLLDFTEEGQKALFGSEDTFGNLKTYYQNFGEEGATMPSAWSHPWYRPERGDRDLTRINDSAFLFASDRLEGFGGYDIFVTYKKIGVWTVQNLGPEINSEFDEISPFLAKDGRTLFYSSNSLQSMGGYDVLISVFDDRTSQWSEGRNPGRPINTGKDETGFRLAGSGKEGVFASNRPEGYGGFDLYQVFFTEPLVRNSENFRPFFQSESYRAFVESGAVPNQGADVKPTVLLRPVYFDRQPVVISRSIRNDLDQILHYCHLYPHIKLTLHIFTGNEYADGFSLFHPYLLLDPVAEYLTDHGLSSGRMIWKIHAGDKRTEKYDENRRRLDTDGRGSLEIEMINAGNLPVHFINGDFSGKSADISYRNKVGDEKKKMQGLKFRVKFLVSDQLFRGDLPREEELMMEISEENRIFGYFSGLYGIMPEAREGLRRIKADGFLEAEIVAVLDGERLTTEKINAGLIETYPELKEYIIYQQ